MTKIITGYIPLRRQKSRKLVHVPLQTLLCYHVKSTPENNTEKDFHSTPFLLLSACPLLHVGMQELARG